MPTLDLTWMYFVKAFMSMCWHFASRTGQALTFFSEALLISKKTFICLLWALLG